MIILLFGDFELLNDPLVLDSFFEVNSSSLLLFPKNDSISKSPCSYNLINVVLKTELFLPLPFKNLGVTC